MTSYVGAGDDMVGIGRLFTWKRALALACVSFLAVIYLSLPPSRDRRWYYNKARCSYPDKRIHDDIIAISKIHTLLNKLKIVHFLCYGTLWGTLRGNKMLPWDPEPDICVTNEALSEVDEGYLYKLFQFDGLTLAYNSPDGLYTVTYGDATVTLTVFEQSEDGESYQRVGLRSRVLPPDMKEKFPLRLLADPLPKLECFGLFLPVPHEDIEIQKYLYPDDWWIEVRPPGC